MKRLIPAVLVVVILVSAPFRMARAQLGNDRELEQRQRDRQRAEQVLRTTRVDLDLEQGTLRQAVEYLAQSSSTNIVIDPRVEADDKEVTLSVRNLPVWNVLQILLSFHKLALRYKFGVFIVQSEEITDADVFIKSYDIRDITFKLRDFPGAVVDLPDPTKGGAGNPFLPPEEEEPDTSPSADDIVDIIKQSTGEEAWSSPKTGISVVNGILVVTNTDEMHQRVAEIIDMLRATR